MAPPDTRGMAPLCAAFVQAYDAADGALLAPFLSEDVLFMGLVADHAGAPAVTAALFGGGERRGCKPAAALATAAPDADGRFDMVIQSVELWPEQMYLDRVTLRGGKVARIERRTMASVAGGGLSNFDGRDRYKLGGRNLTAEESTERVCYTWQAERFLCTGFMHLLPEGTVIPAEHAKDNS